MENESSRVGVSRYFSKVQKAQILLEHIDQGIPISQLARKNGISAVSIYQWKRLMKQDDENLSPASIKELLFEIASLKQENKKLKVKVADLSVSNDILTDALDIVKKRALLRQAQLQENSKKAKNIK